MVQRFYELDLGLFTTETPVISSAGWKHSLYCTFKNKLHRYWTIHHKGLGTVCQRPAPKLDTQANYQPAAQTWPSLLQTSWGGESDMSYSPIRMIQIQSGAGKKRMRQERKGITVGGQRRERDNNNTSSSSAPHKSPPVWSSLPQALLNSLLCSSSHPTPLTCSVFLFNILVLVWFFFISVFSCTFCFSSLAGQRVVLLIYCWLYGFYKWAFFYHFKKQVHLNK